MGGESCAHRAGLPRSEWDGARGGVREIITRARASRAYCHPGRPPIERRFALFTNR